VTVHPRPAADIAYWSGFCGRRRGLVKNATPFGPYEAHYLDGWRDGKPIEWNLERRTACP
jgi:hypothetical protein